ncbi:MAG TPA: VOC family protein [Thermoanaerobaculia bacterium]|nr:VOC family protein [Thermoanaerobaculia bacterium]
MAERNLIERLDAAIDAILADRRGGLALADPELATLLIAASDLRDLPDPRFKQRLKEELVPATATASAPALKPGFHTVTPYLLVRPAAKMIDFLRDVFGAEEHLRVPDASGRLLHAELQIGNSIFELSDGSDEFPTMPSAFHVYIDDADAAYARAIAAGATSLEEPVDQPYGDREAGVLDPFGNQWWIATHVEDVSDDEMMRRFAEPKALTPQAGVGPAPRGYWTVNSGARVNGAARLIDFLRDAFGAEVHSRTEGDAGSVRHADIRIGDSIFEVSDARGAFGPMHSAVHLWVDDVDATYARAVAAGARIIRPPADAPHGERSASIVDPLGNHWYIGKPL